MGHHPNLPFPTADPKVELRSPPSKYLAAAIVIVHGPTSPSSSAGGLAVPAAPCRGGCSSPWPVFAMPTAPRRGSASPSSSAGPPGSAGHGGARPRPGHGGARPPLSRRLGPRRSEPARGAAVARAGPRRQGTAGGQAGGAEPREDEAVGDAGPRGPALAHAVAPAKSAARAPCSATRSSSASRWRSTGCWPRPRQPPRRRRGRGCCQGSSRRRRAAAGGELGPPAGPARTWRSLPVGELGQKNASGGERPRIFAS